MIKMDKSQVVKPITVVREEFVAALSNLINTSKLPPFVIEPILKDMYNDIKLLARRQYEQDKEQYESMLKAVDNN